LSKLLVIIAGPTASGKTRLAIDLALHFNTEIVSADSRQFFRELSIGTAKPSTDELSLVKHHFINSHSVSETITAGKFGEAAVELLNSLFQKKDVVIVAGGSGLYIDALLNGLDDLPSANQELREKLNGIFLQDGITALREKLKETDPVSWSKIDLNNPRRIIRALEVTLSSGKPYSSFLRNKGKSAEWDWLIAGISWPREELYKRINDRTGKMISDGLLDETKNVIQYRGKNALSTVGYREMFDHIDGKISLEEATGLIAQHTRNYAKRQLTWFRKYPEMIWINPGEESKLVEIINAKISS